MTRLLITNIIFLLMMSATAGAQDIIDNALDNLQRIPAKYITGIDKKIKQYSNRITGKTEKTLTKLSRWENKIKGLLQKVSPETADRLFGNNQPTFTSLLQKIKQGGAIALQYQAPYNKYRDDITTSLKYLAQQKEQLDSGLIKKVKATGSKMKELAMEEDNSEALQQFIKERKKQLIEQAVQYIGKSKWLQKINKEAYYYAETLKNYKELFADSKKAEETVKGILNKIPAFQEFFGHNSQLAGFFSPATFFPNLSGGGTVPIVNGIPSRASLQNFMETSMPILTTNPIQQMQIPSVKEQIGLLQNKLNDIGGMGNKEMPDFKPNNTQHAKPFKKRIEYGMDFQFTQTENYRPTIANISLKLGYRINDKSSAGAGINYVMGLGEGWNKISISNEGFGFRTYLKWKLTKGLDIQGGSEWNHLKFTDINQLKIKAQWQQAALIGISKNYSVNKKVKGNFQVLYDFLYNQHIPVSQPVVARFGYAL